MKQACLLLTAITALSLSTLAQDANVAIIELKPSANPSSPLAYEKTELSVKAGQKVKLTLNNSGGILPQPHNFLLLKPGKLDAVGALANAMLADPQGMAKSYIPEAAKPDILANTKLVQPNASETIEFTAPAEAGDYPYICTFPGHWMLMRGVMHVTK
jgi:azurin